MAFQNLEYALRGDFIHHWLVAGPFTKPVAEVTGPSEENLVSGLSHPEDIADRATMRVGEFEGRWRYFRCLEDHRVDVTHHSARAEEGFLWAYTHLEFSQGGEGGLTIYSDVPVTVWWNGQWLGRTDNSAYRGQRIPVQLEHSNDLLVRMEWTSSGLYAHAMAVRLDLESSEGSAPEGIIRLKTQAKYPKRQQTLEEAFEKAYLESPISYRGTRIHLGWAEDAPADLRFAYQIQDAEERIYVEGSAEIHPEEKVDIGHPIRIFERPYRVVLRAPNREYYDMGLRYQAEIPLYILDNAYSDASKGDYSTRRKEALEDAVRRSPHLFAEIARLELGRVDEVDWKAVQQACEEVAPGVEGSELTFLGLLGMVKRYREKIDFPQAFTDRLSTVAFSFPYSDKEISGESYWAARQACAVLAGQLWPEGAFASGESGKSVRERGESSLLTLLREKGKRGFAEWGSDVALERWIVLLSHLVGLAENENLAELSAVLLDRILFSLALHQHRGVLALPAQNTSVWALKSGQLQAISGVQYLLWGMGVLQQHIMGVVSLACSEYEFPSFFADLAVRTEETILSREGHDENGKTAHLLMYRTPDYTLSSVQDYRPGDPGKAERVWQAILGSEAIVYTNHPASAYDDDAHRPGFWLGNGVLPRVAQYQNILFAAYRLPEDDWMPWTHAYFPVSEFDETRFEGGWAFARKGDGYLAITARQGIELIRHGKGAYRELRSHGVENMWICVLGRKADFQDFRGFQKKTLKGRLEWRDGLGVSFYAPIGDEISFGWEGDLLVNGVAQPLYGDYLIENRYCTAQQGAGMIDIQYEGMILRLNFE
ncbi:MAG TPA: hypothetical protein DEQ80_06990 [Anaerolinea thermolimosa]|uniref:Uncharacterized protein n=1 Tax=Anaerolinea thermolimosa TaxID=229919 RepID=A0A3D1JIJ0_9CHLR|nr:hypothetical protein [Anaerolinea thermolimosa]